MERLGLSFPEVLEIAASDGVPWVTKESLVCIKPGRKKRVDSYSPKVPITLKRVYSQGFPISIARISQEYIIPLVSPEERSQIRGDAFAILFTNESGQSVSVGNKECAYATGFPFTAVMESNRLSLAETILIEQAFPPLALPQAG